MASGRESIPTLPEHDGDTGQSAARQVYTSIREEIIALKLRPGEPINELRMVRRFGVSRSPIREALIRLEADGLIQMLPNKGTIVAPLHIEEFPQYIDALDLIQRTVTHLAAKLRTEHDLEIISECNETFKAAVKSHDVIGMIDANRHFHLAISEAARNKHFTHLYRRLLDEGRRIIRLYYLSYNDSPPQSRVETHDMIIKAIADRNATLAEQLAHEHAVKLSERFITYLNTRLTSELAVVPQAAP